MQYHSVRGRGRYARRSRVSALPQSSIGFLVLLSLLAVYHSISLKHTDTETSLEQSDPAEAFFHSVRQIPNATSVNEPSTIDYGGLCTGEDNFFASKFTLFFLIPAVIVAFVGLAIVTDDYFVSALERICERLDLSADVAGATFMAAGSSTPEFFASLLGVFVTKDEIGVGTIVGSAVFNVLVIIGLSAALAGSVLKLDWRPLMRDTFFYIVSIVLLLTFVLGPTRGQIDWWEGLILMGTYVVYILFMAFGNKPYMKWAGSLKFFKKVRPVDLEAGLPGNTAYINTADISDTWANNLTPNASTEKPRYGDLNPRTRLRALQFAVIAANRLASSSSDNSEGEAASVEEEENTRKLLGIDLPSSVFGWVIFPITFIWRLLFSITIVDCSSEKNAKYWIITFIMSILWISGISYCMVEAARVSGCLLGIPAPALGLTVIAAGTSVPDALASISVARDGAGDMAVSNAIGSNVFDILLGLGIPWFLGSIINDPILIPTEPITTVVVPILILFSIIIALIFLLIVLNWELKPLLGYILFGLYAAFVTYTLLDVFVFKIGYSKTE